MTRMQVSNPHRIQRTLRNAVHFVVAAVTLLTAAAASAQQTSIPSVQQWTSGSGSYTFSSSSRIVEDANYQSQVNTTAYVLQSDISYLKGVTPQVVVGAPAAGDIYLTLNSTNSQLGTEGYSMTIGNSVTISARSNGVAGLFYGTRTLLQYLRQTNNLTPGTVNDWPAYPMRGLMVDVGDKFFTIQWLEDHIRDLSYLKLNTLHLHLTDINGFRIQSTSHPELNNGTSPLYSHSDISTLVQLGQQYQINIIPEIESPSHANRITAAHPELELGGNPTWLDISLSGTYTLMNDLMNEYLPLFPGPYWHEGLDEYVGGSAMNSNTYPQLQNFAVSHYGSGANSVDAYWYYSDWLDGIVRSAGKASRAWEDPLEYSPSRATFNTDIAMELWCFEDPSTAIGAGFNISNATASPLYFNVGLTANNSSSLLQSIYNWAPNLNYGQGCSNNYGNISATDPHLQGAKYHIWCNSGDDTETNISNGISSYMRAVAQGCWGSSKPSFSTFSNNITTIGIAPGFGTASGPITPGNPGNGGSAPSAPTGLTATAGNGQASLTWSASSGATSYNVYRGTSSGGESGTPVATGVTSTSYTNTGLTNGTKYYFKVAAVNSTGTSGMSNEASATPAASGYGGTPYGGTAAAIPGTVQVENYDVGGQNVAYNDTTSGNSGAVYRTDDVDIEACTDTGGGYNLGWVAAGEWLKFTVNVSTAGAYTVGFRVASTSAGQAFHLANSSGTNLTGTVTCPNTGGWQTWSTVNATVTLPAGQQVLQLVSDTGNYNYNYMTFALNSAPAVPTGIGAAGGNGQVSLSWSASSGATSYNVYRGTSSGGESGTPVATGVTSTSYTNTGLTNGTTYYFKVAAVNSNGTSGLSNEASATPAASGYTGTPYGGTAAAIPGTVQVENYDVGGQNVAYNDTTSGNSGGVYRTDDVDIEACTDTGGGYNLGWVAAGEWLKFTVNVSAAGTYTAAFRVACTSAGQTFHLANSSGTNLTGSVTCPNTGGWQTWATVNATVTLPAGKQVLQLVADTGNYNFNSMTFSLGSGYAGTPYGGTAWAIPGTIQAENYDLGGQNVAYFDTTSGNSGGVYRTDSVDIEACSDTGGGYDVGGIAATEWQKFTVNVGTAKTYTVTFRVASGGAGSSGGGTLHLEDETGKNLTGTVTIPGTGGWQTWTNVTASATLSAGSHVIKLSNDTVSSGYNLNSISLN